MEAVPPLITQSTDANLELQKMQRELYAIERRRYFVLIIRVISRTCLALYSLLSLLFAYSLSMQILKEAPSHCYSVIYPLVFFIASVAIVIAAAYCKIDVPKFVTPKKKPENS